MRIRFILAAGAVLLAPVASAIAEDAKVERGRAVFVEQKCTLCHSVAGKGSKKGPLDAIGTKLTAAEIREWIVDPVSMTAKTKSTRKPPMKKKAMPPEDVDALVALLSTLKKS